MKKNYLKAFFTILLLNQFSFSQSTSNWQIINEFQTSKTIIKLERKIIPNKYKVFSLDFKSLKADFKSASKRDQNNKLASTLVLDFPLDNGTTESFLIEKTSVLHPDLEAKYPEIQSFYGVSKKNPLNKIYISISPEGFTGVITGEKTIYIDPYSKNNVNDYIVYDRTDYDRSPNDSFVCNAVMDEDVTKLTSSTSKTNNLKDSKLRTYRIAIACTSEYTAYYGNTIAGALAGINTTMTRVNSVYRRDLAVQFQVVANNDRLIYKDNFNKDASPDADPYDNYDGGQMLGVNSGNIDGLLGTTSYDIGHVFSTGGGGIAGVSPCTTTSGTTSGKGKGVTGIVTPQFDPFDIDYVCHEIGHQFGAGHTQNNACQFSATSGLEPGSGSTIMSYAGICPPNIQNNSDAYFHAISIAQMTATINGNTCEIETAISNAAPIITALSSYSIPKSTPFILTCSGTDSDAGDALTYTWEQMNGTASGLTGTPQSTRLTGPNFKSFTPTTSSSRTFPNLNAIISNTNPTWEVLPSVVRTLNFRLTVRDNNSLGGQTNQANMTVTIGNVGPFAVTSPNTTTTWYVGDSKTVTWDFTGTNTATYALNVDIKLSTDGGLTYPITLLANTPNDGTQAIIVPNNIGTRNRIKLEAVGNIFFDISNADFEIKSNKFDLTTSQSTVSVCKPDNAMHTINYVPAPGFTETVTFSAVGLPVGATAVFTPATRNASGSVTMTISTTSSLAAGTYNLNVRGTSATAIIDLPVTLKVFDSNIGNILLTTPVNGAENQQTSVLLQWNTLAIASSYSVEIASNPNFSTLIETATVTGNSYQTSSLTNGTINYWRVKPINPCLSGNYSETFVFQIASDFCKTYTNKYFEGNTIWEQNSTNAVIAKMDIPDNIVISKASFYMKATHASLLDIKMQFSGPTGIFVEVFNRDCSGANFDVTFDDDGTPLTCGDVDPLTSAALEGIQQASQPLSKFNGSSSLGTWTLLATDRGVNTSGGTFTDFKVIICGKLQIVNNITTVYNALIVPIGTTMTVTQNKLEALQPSATPSQLIYKVTQLPINGILKLNNVASVLGGTFTQADINNNLLSYTNNGANTNPDTFKYSITGINNAFLGGQTAAITICTPLTPTFTAINSICSGTSLTALPTTSLNNITGTWSPELNNTATTMYTFTPNAGQCATITTLTITVDLTTIGGIVNGGTAICTNSSTGLLTLSGYTGTILNWESSVSPFTTWITIANSNNTFTSGVLTETTQFRAIIKNGTCNAVASLPASVIIESTSWNGGTWSNGLPNSGKSVTITGNFTVTSDLTACNLTVDNNAVVLIKTGFNLNIASDVIVASGSTLTFENNTNLLQTKNTNSNAGNIIIKRQTSDLKLSDYVLWSAPVTGQQLQSFSPSTLSNRFYTYNPNTSLYNAIVPTSNFAIGTGYLIRMPNNHPTLPTIWEGQFQGVPNNGNYNVAVTNNAYNAIGNPYPSTIDANTFIATNNITEALYFWRKTNNTAASSYATYTTAGGTANAGGLNSIVPNGIIQVGQGFVAKATAPTISFTNAMRISNTANQFLKTKETELHRIWLNLSKDATPVNQMLIAYIPKATSAIDATIDGRYINDNTTALNSLIENEEFVIQGRSLPFSDTDVVPLTFKTNTAGNFTIAIDHVDGLFTASQNIFLNDKVTSANHDLKKTSYSFTSSAGTFNDRFEIVYKGNVTLGLEDAFFNENTVLVYNQKGIININAGKKTIAAVKIFDIRGRLIYEKNNINSTITALDPLMVAHQTLIVQITSDENRVVSKKLMH